jgi:predicted RNase H-like HicB family nuclease
MTQRLNLTANVWREDDMFIAQCLEFDVASQGDTVEEALDNLREAIQLYLESPTATVL